jgi:hypothetical protein
MLIGPVRYVFALIRLQGPVFTALPGCRATALPLKREVAPTPVVARLMAATSVSSTNHARPENSTHVLTLLSNPTLKSAKTMIGGVQVQRCKVDMNAMWSASLAGEKGVS